MNGHSPSDLQIDTRRSDAQIAAADDDEHAAEIKRVLDGGFRWLRFPSALEALFEHRQRDARDRYLIVISLLGILVQNIFLINDATLIPDVFQQALHLRLAWAGFMLIGIIPLALQPPVWLRESMFVIGATLLVGVILYLSSISHAATAIYHPFGMVLIPMFVCIVCRLRFWYALTLSALTEAGPLMLLQPESGLQHVIGETFSMVMHAGTLFSVLACYRLEHRERASFLLCELDRLHRDQLKTANAQLHDLTTLDPLTGISNRRRFETVLNTMWKQAQDSAVPLALLVIDVDAFKPYNDRYGHPGGDACLKRVAAALQSAHGENTIVARIGGDEFAAVGIGLDQEQALALAHAMHAGVAALSIPHRHSPVTSIVSLSIGVASLRPQPWDQPQELMDLADRAVYEAKAAGRNCVRGIGAGPRKSAISLVGGRAVNL